MPPVVNPSQKLAPAYWLTFAALLSSIVFNWRAVTSISLGVLLILSVLDWFLAGRKRSIHQPVRMFFIAALLYGLIYLVFEMMGPEPGWSQLQVRSALWVVPLFFLLSGFVTPETGSRLFHLFGFFLCLAFLYCLGNAFFDFRQTGSEREFFYYELSDAIRGHAVYLSMYVFVTLVFLMESIKERRWEIPRSLHLLISILLVIFLVLLASKLVITFFCLYLLYFFYTLLKSYRRKRQLLIAMLVIAIGNAALLLSTENPVKQRFTDLKGGLTIPEKSDPSVYMNGLQFRLLQWKLVPAILNEKKAWPTGVGFSQAQPSLNKKYMERNMYRGTGGDDTGYLAFNAHNQYLQDLLQGGIPSLAAFLLLCFALISLFLRRRSVLMLATVAIVLTYVLVESLLETQYGVLIFCFLPLWVFFSSRNQRVKRPGTKN